MANYTRLKMGTCWKDGHGLGDLNQSYYNSSLRLLLYCVGLSSYRHIHTHTGILKQKQLRRVGTSKHNCLCILFITLATTCFGRCGPSSNHKILQWGKLYTVWTWFCSTYSRLSTKSRWICTTLEYVTQPMFIQCIVYLIVKFCDLKMTHRDRNMSSPV